jgi:hypothetical protein
MGVLIVILIAGVVAAGIWLSYYLKKRRRDELGVFAKQYGLSYSQADPYDLLGYDFKLLRQGDGRGCENVLAGAWQGVPIKEADYWYYTESTDGEGHRTKSYKYFSVVIADVGCSTPYVSVAKESLFTRMADHMGFRDIDFESEDFNREFNVKSEDREFAFKLIDARMMQFLMDSGGKFGFEVRGPTVLTYCHRMRPPELVPLFGTAKGFNDHIPRLVWNEYGTGRAQAPAEAPAAAPAPPAPQTGANTEQEGSPS